MTTLQARQQPSVVFTDRTAAPARRFHPAIAVVIGALGVAVVGISFLISRTGRTGDHAEVVFWVGFVILVAPFVVALLADNPTRTQRIWLVVSLGLLIYAVRVIHDPLSFVMADEFFHARALQDIVRTGSLFTTLAVPGQNVSASFPGLEAITAALAETSGLSLFVSGLIVIGLARLMIMLAVFLFAERITGSTRVGGLSAMLFTANANFLFFSTQYSYESLAFPLFMVTFLLLLIQLGLPGGGGRAERAGRAGRGTAVSLGLMLLALTTTHHLTTYAFVAVLWVMSLLSLRPRWRAARCIPWAIAATAVALAWLLVAGGGTVSYLSGIAGETTKGISALLTGSGRAPFQSSTAGLASPLPERVVAYLGLILMFFGIVWMLRRSSRFPPLRQVTGVLIMLSAAGFLCLYPFRAASAAWQTGNRGQELLFPGTAALLTLGALRFGSENRRWRRLALFAASMIVIAGGVISGWPYPQRLPVPTEVRASNGRTLVPPGYEVSSWAVAHLPRRSTYLGEAGTTRELLLDGANRIYLAVNNTDEELLHTASFPSFERKLLGSQRLDYIVSDRRKLTENDVAAYFFQTADSPFGGAGLYPAAASTKFAQAGASLVYSTGDISVFDVAQLRSTPPCEEIGLPTLLTGITCAQGGAIFAYPGPSRIAALPDLSVHLLNATVQGDAQRLTVSFTLRLQNTATRALPSWEADLVVGGRQFPSAPGSSGNPLPPESVLPGGFARVVKVSFALTDPAVIAVGHRAGVTLQLTTPASQPSGLSTTPPASGPSGTGGSSRSRHLPGVSPTTAVFPVAPLAEPGR